MGSCDVLAVCSSVVKDVVIIVNSVTFTILLKENNIHFLNEFCISMESNFNHLHNDREIGVCHKGL